jgi:hypothetical protein
MTLSGKSDTALKLELLALQRSAHSQAHRSAVQLRT